MKKEGKMQQINDLLDTQLLKRQESEEKRKYLGASGIGDDCLRKIQLQYMQSDKEISARTVRTFDIGHTLEPLVAEWLRVAGFDLRTHDENGKQFGFSAVNGKLKGHVDGIIFDFPPQLKLKPQALWECKTMNDKNWNDTKKRGVLVSKPMYFAQIQLYMAYMNLDENPCIFTAVNKNTSEIYFELIPFDVEAAQRYSDRAVQIIQATENGEAMPCISKDPSFFRCKMCGYRAECLRQRGLCE
jgi:hypothetical protein